MPMRPPTKHKAGAILLWGSPLPAFAGLWLARGGTPVVGLVLLALSVPLALFGAWLKKKNCPRCQADRCEMAREDPD